MKVYLAGERNIWKSEKSDIRQRAEGWSKNVKRRLFSYYYHKMPNNGVSFDVTESYKLGLDLFLDSGAYTAFTQDVNITIDAYSSWINKHGNLFTTRSNLDDTNKNEQLSYDNLKALETLGCIVQPVFHAREDPCWLVKYLDEGYSYIFIGGMVPETTQWLMSWLDEIFSKYLSNKDGTPRVKLHGFGLTDQKLMFRYPWYSVDSTSWLMTGNFGSCTFLDKSTGKLVKVVMSSDSPEARKWKGWHYTNLTPDQKEVVDEWLVPYGVTAAQCATHYSFRDVVNAGTYQQLESMGASKFVIEQEGLF